MFRISKSGVVLTLLILGAVGAQAADRPPTPIDLKIAQDDHAAILTWNGGPLRPDRNEPPDVSGYRIVWGPADDPTRFVKLTTDRIIQLQPLENGPGYRARVDAVDHSGRLSEPGSSISFTGDATRVNALRAAMTGFFDDFNLEMGELDELKWNTAYSHANDPAFNGAFINDQFHAHNMVSNLRGFSDREQVVNRPRAVFDFTDRIGTLVFDFDGEFRRDQWYLDMVPTLMDITGQVNVEGGGRGHPGDFIRFRQSGQFVGIIRVDPDGSEHTIAGSSQMQWNGLNLVTNVRRHWVIHFAQNYADIFLDGVPLVSTSDFQLSYSRVYPLWTAFSYNTVKGDEPVMLIHWDNFGFDAPDGSQPAIETHNYRLQNGGTDFLPLYNNMPGVKTLSIPDDITGSLARRLMFCLQMDRNQFYTWNPNDRVTVNGIGFAIPEPTSATGLPSSALVSGNAPYSMCLDIPDGVFQSGDNAITFTMARAGVNNVHAEFDFDIDAPPSYTQPAIAAPGSSMPAMMAVGPGAIIRGMADRPDVYIHIDNIRDINFNVRGVIPVYTRSDNSTAMLATGSNPGISRVELLLDGNLIATQSTGAESPAPSAKVIFTLDTTKIPNGEHRLFVRAYSGNGTPGTPGYSGALSHPQIPCDIRITVQN